MLNQPASFAEDIHPALMAVVYFIAPNRRVAIGGDPDSSKVVGVYLIVYKLAQS